MTIVLATLNAKYIHASLGLRYLAANMGDLRARTQVAEFVIAQRPADIVESLLQREPTIIGLGVYIWNAVESLAVVRLLKTVAPHIKLVLGGPEVSHETAAQEVVQLADHTITGWGDVSFPSLCRALLFGPPPLMKIIAGVQPPLDAIALPYDEYSDADIANRLLYVEASRGCPFKCEFCLSSLDKTAWAFDTERFMGALESLYARGARNFKFVDRTFNLKVETSVQILQFFLDRIHPITPDLFVHFEVIPDHLPVALKTLIAQFPPGTLQFEVGIQSFTPEVQQLISRRADNLKTAENIAWLVQDSHAHVHADLIFGLPGETVESFADSFNKLYRIGPHEIQFGMLKRLRGTPIIRHTAAFDLRFDAAPPYTIVSNSTVSFTDTQRMNRFSRYWDLVANSGRFTRSTRLLCEGAPFENFCAFTDWLYATTGKTHEFALERLVDALLEYLCRERQLDAALVGQALAADYLGTGARGNPKSLAGFLPVQAHLRSNRRTPGDPALPVHSADHAERQKRFAREIAEAAAAA